MEATIEPRAGMPDEDLAYARHWNPMKAPDMWLTREDAAAALKVDPRTIDRYVRNRKLTLYKGPVPGRLHGVRVLKSEVDNWKDLSVRVVPTDG
jgi:hypothetical protein